MQSVHICRRFGPPIRRSAASRSVSANPNSCLSPQTLRSPLIPRTLSPTAMAPLTPRCSSLLRSLPRRNIRALPSTLPQRRHKADVVQRAAGEFDQTPSGQSPFRNLDENPTTRVPDFSKYMSSKGETRNKTFQYFMVGSMGLLAAAGAKATVQGELMCSGCWHFEAAQMGVRETKG